MQIKKDGLTSGGPSAGAGDFGSNGFCPNLLFASQLIQRGLSLLVVPRSNGSAYFKACHEGSVEKITHFMLNVPSCAVKH